MSAKLPSPDRRAVLAASAAAAASPFYAHASARGIDVK
jgi:hypothetical protein